MAAASVRRHTAAASAAAARATTTARALSSLGARSGGSSVDGVGKAWSPMDIALAMVRGAGAVFTSTRSTRPPDGAAAPLAHRLAFCRAVLLRRTLANPGAAATRVATPVGLNDWPGCGSRSRWAAAVATVPVLCDPPETE